MTEHQEPVIVDIGFKPNRRGFTTFAKIYNIL